MPRHGRTDTSIADPRILSWGTKTETDCEKEHSFGLKRQYEDVEASRKPAFGTRTLHPEKLIVCCRSIRASWHGASCAGEILRFSTVSLPEVRKKRGAEVDFQALWADVSTQKLQVSPRGASDWWRESVRNSVSVHQVIIRGSAILPPNPHQHAPGGPSNSSLDSFLEEVSSTVTVGRFTVFSFGRCERSVPGWPSGGANGQISRAGPAVPCMCLIAAFTASVRWPKVEVDDSE